MIKVSAVESNNLDFYLERFVCKVKCDNLHKDMEKNISDPTVDLIAMEREGETVCFFGIKHLRIGVGEVWILPGRLVNKYKFEFFKTIYRMIQFGFEKMGLHRMEMAISTAWEEGAKWAEKLGFQFEGICRAYDHHFQDHGIYSRIKIWQPEQ